MQPVQIDLTLADIAVRLCLTLIAAGMIGFNRETHDHTAGLRTTMLVGLAAAVCMVLANILIGTTGKTATSFVNFDPMRLPLGVLTGVGFIGGGAILKHQMSITGVTTAATLWIMTAIGLCFGAGQLILGGLAAALGFFTLLAMKWLEQHFRRKNLAIVTILTSDGLSSVDLDRLIGPLGCRTRLLRWNRMAESDQKKIVFEIEWWRAIATEPSYDFIKIIEANYHVDKFVVIRYEV